MLQFSCRFACYHVIVSQTAYRKKTWILTLHQANAPTFTRFSFLKHTPKLIIFGTRNLRTHTHIIQNLGFDARVCVQDSCRRRQWAETASRRLLVKSVLNQDIIDDAIDQWQVRLRVCVKAKAHHFWASSALKPALFRATHDFRRNMHYFRYAVWGTITW